jgi:hypothetical protein
MRYLTIILILMLVSCKKNQLETLPDTQVHVYTLNFQLDNETDGPYYIQKSIDGLNFQSIDSVSYDPTRNGNYSFDVHLRKGEFVRVAINQTEDSTVYSTVLKAD